MPTVNLNQSEKEQWTVGAPNLLSSMLIEGFMFLRDISTVKKSATKKDASGKEIKYYKYEIKMPIGTDNIDVTNAYQKVLTNITDLFAPTGSLKLTSPGLKNEGRPLDYSALLGAYFRQTVRGEDGEPIVQLNEDELKAVYKFVAPVIGKQNPKIYLDSITKLHPGPKASHLAVLSALIFKDVTPNEKSVMFKEKDKAKSENFVEAMLTTVEFMRTPFQVLISEERAGVAKAKKAGGIGAKTSGVDLSWLTMLSVITNIMNAIIAEKSSSEQAGFNDAKKQLRDFIQKAQGSFAATNASYTAQLEIDKLLGVFGGAGTTVEDFTKYIAWFKEETIKAEPGISNAEKAKINKMSLRELFVRFEQQQTALLGEAPESFAAYVAYYREEVIKAEGDGISEAERAKINKMSVSELLEKNIKQQDVALKSERDYGVGLGAENTALTEELATAKAANATLKKDLTDQLSTQKIDYELQIAAKSAVMDKQKLELDNRNKLATKKLPELNQKLSEITKELDVSKEKIKELEQQLAKDKSAEPAAAVVVKSEQAYKADEWPLLKALAALQIQAGEPSEKSFDEKLYDFCERKLEALSNGKIKDPAKMLGEIKVLTNIMTATKTIEGILNTSSSGKNKASIIHDAMKGMEVEKRHELLKVKNLKPGQEFPTAQGFVDGLLIQRKFFKTAEASSFTMFKKEMAKISTPLTEPEEAPKPAK